MSAEVCQAPLPLPPRRQAKAGQTDRTAPERFGADLLNAAVGLEIHAGRQLLGHAPPHEAGGDPVARIGDPALGGGGMDAAEQCKISHPRAQQGLVGIDREIDGAQLAAGILDLQLDRVGAFRDGEILQRVIARLEAAPFDRAAVDEGLDHAGAEHGRCCRRVLDRALGRG